MIDDVQRAALDAAQAEIERAVKSSQPRIAAPKDPEAFWASTMTWLQTDEPPPYAVDSRKRDAWLRAFWPREPHLAGVLNSSCLIDSNRGWSLVGGRNQVRRYADILHNIERGKGWRFSTRKGALSFRTSDLGAVYEIGREGSDGPLATLWNVDPVRCKLAAGGDSVLYYPPRGPRQEWDENKFFRIGSMISTDETYNDLGYCALSRAVELARTMIAVYQHDQEQLGSRAPKGLLLLKNISESMWTSTMKSRDAQLDSYERMYYGGVAVFASAGLDDIDAKLIALSTLPAGFDKKTFMDLTMFGYALCFGYDPNEFWPVQSGALGRGRESEIQHQKATGKGVMDFTTEFQECIQRLLPRTIEFEFDERDDDGELRAAEVNQAKVNVIKAMYETGLQQGVPMIQQWQAQQLLAAEGMIPPEWTAQEEDVTADDADPFNDEKRARAIALAEHVQRAAFEFPAEPIIEYTYRAGRASEKIIFDNARHLERFVTRTRRRTVKRADDSAVLYESGEVKITVADVDRAIADGGKNIGLDWLQAVTNGNMTAKEIADNPVIE